MVISVECSMPESLSFCRGWTAGKKELEQASLVLQLLCTLTDLEVHMPRSAPQFKAAVYLMTLRLGVMSSKSSLPAVATVLDSQASEDASSKHAELVSSKSKMAHAMFLMHCKEVQLAKFSLQHDHQDTH